MKVTHEVFLQRLSVKNPNIEPLEEYKGYAVNIMCRCKICGNEWLAAPANLLRGRDCPKCSRKRGYAKMAETKREYWRQKKAKADAE